MPEPVPSDTDRAIAARVAELVPDRATVQFGIGGLPSAVCAALAGHRDLGIHSGIITDAAVDLIEAGVVTNAAKGVDQIGRAQVSTPVTNAQLLCSLLLENKTEQAHHNKTNFN